MTARTTEEHLHVISMPFLLDNCLSPNDDRYKTNERCQLWQVAENQAIGSNLQLVFMPS